MTPEEVRDAFAILGTLIVLLFISLLVLLRRVERLEDKLHRRHSRTEP